MKLERKITRRQALQIAAGATVPMFIPARLLGDDVVTGTAPRTDVTDREVGA